MLRSNRSAGGCVAPTEGKRRSGHGRLTTSSSVAGVGPVHAGIIEPGHFRFSCSGETVVRLEERLGYVHKGIEGRILQS